MTQAHIIQLWEELAKSTTARPPLDIISPSTMTKALPKANASTINFEVPIVLWLAKLEENRSEEDLYSSKKLTSQRNNLIILIAPNKSLALVKRILLASDN